MTFERLMILLLGGALALMGVSAWLRSLAPAIEACP